MVGTVVLFRLDQWVQRPLLVVDVTSDGLTGAVFVDWENDRVTKYCRDHQFFSGSGYQTNFMVYQVKQGDDIGEWQPLPRGRK